VGVFLLVTSLSSTSSDIPHTCGGVSIGYEPELNKFGHSPRPWGCFFVAHRGYARQYCFNEVSPLLWGCFRLFRRGSGGGSIFPHTRGDVSNEAVIGILRNLTSPRLWGCFWRCVRPQKTRHFFPTSVGVFLALRVTLSKQESNPHTRGGVSAQFEFFVWKYVPSPHLWGCFFEFVDVAGTHGVFPTLVGGAYIQTVFETIDRSSPHPWGCFCEQRAVERQHQLFPTLVGVFPSSSDNEGASNCLPHVCGGVSTQRDIDLAEQTSSPHPWGCFPSLVWQSYPVVAFPTLVGVFPRPSGTSASECTLPHIRGGVSHLLSGGAIQVYSSPHPWGCFSANDSTRSNGKAFPTLVGCFSGHGSSSRYS